MKAKWTAVIASFGMLIALTAIAEAACDQPVSYCPVPGAGSFALVRSGQPAAVYVDESANSAVKIAVGSFTSDLAHVAGKKPLRLQQIDRAAGPLVIVGVLGQSPVIDGLVKSGKIDVREIAGHWEAFRQIVVSKPFPNVSQALVVVGSDRRGAVFGLYDISEKMGVSPLVWLADVSVKRQQNVFFTTGSRADEPKVKYRGIFINDEAPGFEVWTSKKFGGANAKAYEHIFELILRMKGNYLWPAMWPPRAFNADDPNNYILADAMGVVMGTSHHEPMMRAYDEWHRQVYQGLMGGKWDYASNSENLRRFWRGGIERMMSKGDGRGYDSLVTIGMRGDGDEPMSEGTATQLLETIVADQRKIISEITGKPAEQVPQVWALYKEVQDYYDHGMTVPDDVTLLFADDNWGQIRRLPTKDRDRKGGYGVYYHFDYVGAPRNYKWLNTNQIEKTWQQMDLAYRRGAKTLWVVNVGDIKPMEYPISFFLQMAWNPEAMTLDALNAYPQQWAAATFGPSQAKAIASILTRYSQFSARRKPELIDANTFALGEGTGPMLNGGEFGSMVGEWKSLENDVRLVKAKLPKTQLDAYFELVEHPVQALSNLYQLYYAVAWNHRLAAVNDPRANAFADLAESAFRRDQALTDKYHRLANGKWDGMMLQTHIGYTTWQEPKTQVMPEVKRVPGTAVTPSFATPSIVAANGVIALEAPGFSRAVDGRGLEWKVIPNLGRTRGAVIALPQGLAPTVQSDGVRLEYDVELSRSGDLKAQLYLVPTLDTNGSTGLNLGVSIDDGPMQTLTVRLTPAPNAAVSPEQKAWVKGVSDNAHMMVAEFPGVAAGKHTVKIWRLDDNVVLQKLVIATDPVPATYLGSPAQK
jgi:hypothetical protein